MLKKIIKAFMRELIILSTKGLCVGVHITRYYMYQHLVEILGKMENKKSTSRVLSISSSRYICRFLNLNDPEIIEADFPKYNLLELPFKNNDFDFIVCEQVLEHIEGDPQKAVDEAYRVLKPGGIAIFTTCFLYPIHGAPKDFWRFSPDALKLLFDKYSYIIDVGGWGNRYVWFLDWLGLRYQSIPHALWHPLHRCAIVNSKDWPVSVWIVTQK